MLEKTRRFQLAQHTAIFNAARERVSPAYLHGQPNDAVELLRGCPFFAFPRLPPKMVSPDAQSSSTFGGSKQVSFFLPDWRSRCANEDMPTSISSVTALTWGLRASVNSRSRPSRDIVAGSDAIWVLTKYLRVRGRRL